MKTVLVPLDGTKLAEKILLDAQRLAGPGGKLVLVRDVSEYFYVSAVWERHDHVAWIKDGQEAIEQAQEYLETQADCLRGSGVEVETHTPVLHDVPLSIDEAARILRVDMIACATHARGPIGRFFRGSVAWTALAHSAVPVMLRHFEEQETIAPEPAVRRIMVPLDGSVRSEAALSLAVALAKEWNAGLWLVSVVPNVPAIATPDALFRWYGELPPTFEEAERGVQTYLDEQAAGLPGEIHTAAFVGPVMETLTRAAKDWGITDVVMASHGRTGLMRVILGSVADALIHRLSCPIIVIPSMAVQILEQQEKPKVHQISVP